MFAGAGVSGHHVGVDVNRIDGICDRDFVLVAENIEDETAVGFRSVGEENLVGRDLDPAIPVIVLRNFRAKEFVTLLVPVTAKRFAMRQLVHGLVHRVHRPPAAAAR